MEPVGSLPYSQVCAIPLLYLRAFVGCIKGENYLLIPENRILGKLPFLLLLNQTKTYPITGSTERIEKIMGC
jgi:hypothetical protein